MRLAATWLLLTVCSPAFADDEPKGAEPKLLAPTKPEPAMVLDLSHKGQFQISLRGALGLRAIAPYQGDTYCGKEDKDTSSGYAPVCTSRAPFALNIELAYGVSRKIDVLLEFGLGLESDFGSLPGSNNGPNPIKLSVGARRFFSEGVHSKLFATGQLLFDFTGYKDPANNDRGNDIGIRNLNGFWYDVQREYGFYAYVGETATFARWFEIGLELGIGIQGRYP